MRTHIKLRFVDNNDKQAQLRVYPGATSETGARAYALALAAALQSVSTAVLVGVEIVWPMPVDNPPAPGPQSDVDVYALLFYRNDARVASIRVPSPGGLPTENAGAYAGVRYTRADLAVSGLLVTVEALVQGVVDGLGRPYPPAFGVGGRVEL